MNVLLSDIEASLAQTQSKPDTTERVRLLCSLAYALRNNEPARAKAACSEARLVAESLGDELGLAEIESVTGVVEVCAADYDAGLVRLFRAVDMFSAVIRRSPELAAPAKRDVQRRMATALRWIGVAYVRISMFSTALEYLARARGIAEELQETFLEAQICNNIGDVHFGLQDYTTALSYYRESLRGLADFDDAEQAEQKGVVNFSIASAYKELGEYTRALIYHQQSLAQRKQSQDILGIGTTLYGIAEVYTAQGKYAEALETYFQAYDSAVANNNTIGIGWVSSGIGDVYLRSGKPSKALEYLEQAEAAVQGTKLFQLLSQILRSLSECHKQLGNIEAAFEYFERFAAIREETMLQDSKQSLRQLQRGFEIEKAQKEAEIYRLKNVELVQANRQNEALLLNILPSAVAAKLKTAQQQNTTTRIAEKFDAVTVLFADIVGFTRLSSFAAPELLVGGLDMIFSMLDELAEKYHLEKIKTIGDAYMLVGGVPEPRTDHCQAVAQFALDAMEHLTRKDWYAPEAHALFADFPLHLRIGIHTGEAVAGVIGKQKFSYDLWGDTVNLASRMESHGEPGRIHISGDVYDLLRLSSCLSTPSTPSFRFEPRGEVDIKGKGMMQTYFLNAAFLGAA